MVRWMGFILVFNTGMISLQAESEVKMWKEAMVIPTFIVAPPDPNPIFPRGRAYQGARGFIYPYPLLDRLTDIREDKTYTALFLENKYLRICVLPEIGGRIFEAVDKTNNYNFIYRQHVIKPALIGMLGAWISGGAEWNVPHHHRATSFMPVDYALEENLDGSKTIWVGELELRHRLKWIVGLTLFPESSIVEVTMKIFNRTPLAHSFLCWANVAVQANVNYQVIFPPSTEYATFHGKNQFSRWPISGEVFSRVDYTAGVDVSWWKNHPAPTSFFDWDSKEDFFGGYDHGKEAGIALVADRHLVPGKKFFTWGTGSDGKMWEKILTDDDGPYLELMFGAYSDNQPDYSWCEPYETKMVKQYWFPIRQLKGLKNATPKAACNLIVTGDKIVQLGFNTTSEHKDAKVLLKAGERILHEEKIDISPQKPYQKEVAFPPDLEEKNLSLFLYSEKNEEIICYKPPQKEGTPMPRPVTPPPPPSEMKTAEELYLTGLRLEQFHNPSVDTYPYFEEALRRDPDDYRVNTALGLLLLKRGLFQEAEEKLRRAINQVTQNYTRPKDCEALYYLGAALLAQGKADEAYDHFYRAAWSPAWHSASYYALAEICARKENLSDALEFVNRSLSTNSLNTKALNLKASLLRRLSRLEEAKNQASSTLAIDPLDFWAGNELYLAESELNLKKEADRELEDLRVKMRDAVQNYLELAVDYGNCGLWDEAIEVLSRIANSSRKDSSSYPLVYYYLGYFWEKKGDHEKAAQLAQTASLMPPDYCFPFRLESIDVLRWAEGINPKDGRAPYYLGNLLFDLQPEKAIAEWEKSKELDGTFSFVNRNLGLAYGRVKNDIPRAIASLEKALAYNRDDPRLYYELDGFYEAAGVSPQKRLKLLEKNHNIVVQRDDALSREILLLVQLGQYDKAIRLMKGHHFHVWEGGGEIHDLYVDAHLFRGREYFWQKKYDAARHYFEAALEFPENLEVGKPYSGGRFPEIYYFIGTAHEATGDIERARDCYEKSVASPRDYSELSYYQGLSLQRLGRGEQAINLFDELIRFAEERLNEGPSADYFAKFGERQSANRQMAHFNYLLGLGYLGKGKTEEAKAEFEKALAFDPNHFHSQKQLSWLSLKKGKNL